MAYQTRDVVKLMTESAGQDLAELRVDGGAAVMDVLLQFQADQLGVAVTRPASTETTAIGAALLAGLAEGIWGSTEEVEDAWQVDRQFLPNPDRSEADARYERWLQAVERSRGWVS